MVRTKKLQRLFERTRALPQRWTWMRPLFERAHLWRWSRRSVAIGAAIGVFFGFLIPVGQIPASAAFAAWFRANLPIAIVSTWITNPITTVPAYYSMYLLGSHLIGPSGGESISRSDFVTRISEVGSAILVGAPVLAILMAVLTFGLVHLGWVLWIRLRRPRLWHWARAYVFARHRARAQAV